MKEGLIFANARAKAKESNLFTKERLLRMMDAKSLNDAIRILLEVNYAGGLVPENDDFYSMLVEEEKIVTAFVRETAPEGAGFECFFLRNDYHNLKVLFKAKYAGIEDVSGMLLPDGNYTFAYLKERFETNKLDFSPFIEAAAKNIEKAFDTNCGSPRLIDVELDKALYADINSRLKKGADKYIKSYFSAFIDSTNVSSYVRCVRIGGNFNFFADGFLEGGTINLKDFEECRNDLKKAVGLLEKTEFKDYFGKLTEIDLAAFETAQDNFLLSIFAVNKNDMFSVAPILGYYLAKLNEIKVLRVVLVCIKNNVPQEEMKKRVRELYA